MRTHWGILLLVFITAVYYIFFVSMDTLPVGDFLKSSSSPDEHYTVNIYLVNGGATVDFAIRGELVDNVTGKIKNIYWNYHESDATISWQDNDTVVINGHVLNIPYDRYDFRNQPAQGQGICLYLNSVLNLLVML